MEKRGQVTIFIILGIIIVVIISLLVYIRSVYIKEGIEVEEVSVPVEVESVKSYIENCLKDEVNLVLDDLYLYGGYLDEQEQTETVLLNGESVRINYLCPFGSYYNRIGKVEDDLETYFRGSVECDLSQVEVSGDVDINDASVIIRDDEILVSVRTNPITVEKGRSSVALERFFVEVNSRFGEIYESERPSFTSGDNSWVYKITYLRTCVDRDPPCLEGDINDYWPSFWRNALRKGVGLDGTHSSDSIYIIKTTDEERKFYFAC